MKTNTTAIALCALTLAAGCTSGTIDERGLPTTLSGVVLDEQHLPVAGVELCPFDAPGVPCAIGDEAGRFELGLPEGESVLVEVRAPNKVPTLYAHTSDWDAFRIIPVLSEDGYASRFAPLADLDATGAISVRAGGVRLGVEVALDPSEAPRPTYVNDDFEVMDRTSTDSSGRAVFVRVTPGEHTVEADRAGNVCASHDQEVVDGGATLLVEAGYLTHVDMWCR